MRIFLDNSMNRRIAVLNFIENSADAVTVKEISEQTGLSKKTIKLFIKEFEREFGANENKYHVNYSNGVIKSVAASNLNVSKISSEYLKQTVLYRMLKYIFLNGHLDVIKFCHKNFISQATFSRHRKKLESILSECGLELSRNNEIIGNEMRIRNFFMMFFSNSSEKWEFEAKYYETIYDYVSNNLPNWFKYTPQEQKKIILILFINDVRSSQKKESKHLGFEKIDESYKKLAFIQRIYDYFSLNKKRDYSQAWDETNIAATFFYKERLIKQETHLKKSCEFFSEEGYYFVHLSEVLADRILFKFFKNQQDSSLYWQVRHEVDLFHLQLETCFIDYRLFSYNYDENRFAHLEPFEKKIRKEAKVILEELMNTDEGKRIYLKNDSFIQKDSLVEYLYLMICALVSQHSKIEAESIKIIVKNSTIFEKDILKHKILALFGEKIEFVGLSDIADLIVTDTKLIHPQSEIPTVYVSTFSDEENMNIVISKIVDLIVEKFYKRKFFT